MTVVLRVLRVMTPLEIAEYVGTPAVVAVLFATLTYSALSLMPQVRKDELALWLMGAENENWAGNFTAMFDALFGSKHWSVICFLRSALASAVSVAAIWLFLSWTGTMERIPLDGMSLLLAVAVGMAVNIVADYFSLLETRWLLGRLARIRSPLTHVALLIIDAVITGLIILGVIWAAQASGLLAMMIGDDAASLSSLTENDPLVIALAFSVFSAPFYSTFLTSVWSWLYVLSSWALRFFARFQSWLDVEKRPVLMVSLFLGIATLGLTGLSSQLTARGELGVSRLDQLACTFGKGPVCERVRAITDDPDAARVFQLFACEGGRTETCFREALERWNLEAARAFPLFEASCKGGDLNSCSHLAYMYEHGKGSEKNIELAFDIYSKACRGGDGDGCTHLGLLYARGVGVNQNIDLAVKAFQSACFSGEPVSCTNLAVLYRNGRGVKIDMDSAVNFLYLGCNGGDPVGCTYLGSLYQYGINVDQNIERAEELYQIGCDGGHEQGCRLLKEMDEQ